MERKFLIDQLISVGKPPTIAAGYVDAWLAWSNGSKDLFYFYGWCECIEAIRLNGERQNFLYRLHKRYKSLKFGKG